MAAAAMIGGMNEPEFLVSAQAEQEWIARCLEAVL